MAAPQDTFFIGWTGRAPKAHVSFLTCVGVAVLVSFGAIGMMLGAAIDDPSRNLFGPSVKPEGWQGDQSFNGVLTLKPYPVLHVSMAPGASAVRSMLLSGSGKRGADVTETAHRVTAAGGLLRRGDIDMLVVDDSPVVQADLATPLQAENLGKWRAVGEICDGKCYPGGMTPGFGLAHRACASLCLIGEVPAIFVTAAPVAGASFLLLAGPDGAAPGPWIHDMIARPVELEGEVEKLGTILIFRVDPARARFL
jgi:hypothetical protein